MTEATREEYIKYRLAKSDETFNAAKILVENNQWNSTINRLYYAGFYAISALLAHSNISVKSHTGVKTQFFLNFVKTNIITKDKGKLYADLFDWRQKGDYGDFFDFQEQDVTPLMKPTEELINSIKKLLS